MTTRFRVDGWDVGLVMDDLRCVFEPRGWLDCTHDANRPSGGPLTLTVEVRAAASGMDPTALLGAEYVPLRDRVIELRVAHTGQLKDHPPSPDSCAGLLGLLPGGDRLTRGLPAEFADAVLRSLVDSVEQIPAGSINVTAAAFDPVNSSAIAFDRATRLLVAAVRLGSTEGSLEPVVARELATGKQ